MVETKNWWQSRTVWVNIVTGLFALLGAFKLLPTSVDQDSVVSVIMGGVAAANIALRVSTRQAIG